MASRVRFAWLAAALFATTGLGAGAVRFAPAPALDGSDAGEDEEQTGLRGDPALELRVFELLDRAAAGDDVLSSLTGLGGPGVPALIAVLSGRADREPTEGELAPEARRTLLLEALTDIDQNLVLQHLQALAVPETALPERAAALAVLARSDHSRAIDLAWKLLESHDPVQLASARVRSSLAPELKTLFERRPQALRKLVTDPSGIELGLWKLAIEAAPNTDSGILFLVDTLGQVDGLDRALLEELAQRTAGSRTSKVELEPLIAERAGLALAYPDWQSRRAAAALLGDVGRADCVPSLVAALSDPQRAVQRAALESLERLSGQQLGADADRWQAWLEGQLAWHEAEWPRMAERLRDGDDAEVLGIVRRLGERKLFRDELAEQLVPVLSSESPHLVGVTCALLGQLGSRRAVPALIEILDRDEPTCRKAAHSALLSLTGLQLPETRAAWRAAS